MRERLLVLVTAVMALAATLGTAGPAAATVLVRPATNESNCALTPGPFSTQGNQMVDGAGNVYVPTGITVFQLAYPNLNAKALSAAVHEDESQITTMATQWCANTVRIQAAPGDLFNKDDIALGDASQPYADAVRSEIAYAEGLGLAVVLTAQTEKFDTKKDPTGGALEPDLKTAAYWQYWSQPGALGILPDGANAGTNVIFDIFNEPRQKESPDDIWPDWLNGAPGTRDIGMNGLVNAIRAVNPSQMLWVQGPKSAQTLSEVVPAKGKPAYQVSNPTNVVYDIHHPEAPHDKASWTIDFGRAAAKVPVVVGEWTNYAGSNKTACWGGPLANSQVIAFTSYLQQHHIGLIAWWLAKGVLLNQKGNPSTIGSPYVCKKGGPDEGAGKWLQGWFKDVNTPENQITPGE
jgi:hypothetical protein